MNNKEKIEALQNALEYYEFDPKYFIFSTADGRINCKYAIAEPLEHGAINPLTRFMTYEEMNAYFYGYQAAQQNKFSTLKTT